jgi:hypothetical protein
VPTGRARRLQSVAAQALRGSRRSASGPSPPRTYTTGECPLRVDLTPWRASRNKAFIQNRPRRRWRGRRRTRRRAATSPPKPCRMTARHNRRYWGKARRRLTPTPDRRRWGGHRQKGGKETWRLR